MGLIHRKTNIGEQTYTPDQDVTTKKPNREARDEITGARRAYDKALNRLGTFLTDADWEATDRKITIFDDNGTFMNLNNTYGKLEFERLSNGNLKADIEIRHAPDNFIISYSYVVALNPKDKTFMATRLDAAGLTAIGSIDRQQNMLYWTDISEGLGAGTTIGDSCVRSMNFINIQS